MMVSCKFRSGGLDFCGFMVRFLASRDFRYDSRCRSSRIRFSSRHHQSFASPRRLCPQKRASSTILETRLLCGKFHNLTFLVHVLGRYVLR